MRGREREGEVLEEVVSDDSANWLPAAAAATYQGEYLHKTFIQQISQFLCDSILQLEMAF